MTKKKKMWMISVFLALQCEQRAPIKASSENMLDSQSSTYWRK